MAQTAVRTLFLNEKLGELENGLHNAALVIVLAVQEDNSVVINVNKNRFGESKCIVLRPGLIIGLPTWLT